jgi:hypothetical protein
MRALGAAALLALASPAAAHAAVLGGGTAPDSVTSSPHQLTFVTLRTGEEAVTLRTRVHLGCGAAALERRVALAPDGSFSITATVRDKAPEDLRRIARLSISGELVGTTASGATSARLTFRRRGRTVAACRSGLREWQARVAAAESGSGPPRAGGAYYGLTSQANRPHGFMLRVDAAGTRVGPAAVEYRRRCRGRSFETGNITPAGDIAADGTFSMRERFTVRYADATERFRVKLDGQFTRTGVHGTLSVTSVARSRAGAVIDRCRTGAVTFAGAL